MSSRINKSSFVVVTGAFVVLALISVLGIVPALAASISVNWSDPTSGDLGGTSVTMTDLSGSLVAFDLSGADYAAAPLSAATQTVEYPSDNNWTATFGTPISNLRLYAVYWRGMGGDGTPVTYTFTAPFTILSGFIGSSVNGNSLSIPDSGWGNGILEFTGPLSTLSVSVENGNNSAQALTFAYNPSACSTMVTSNADSGAGSLRDAIACVAPGDTVTFSPSLTGQTIVLTTTEIAVTQTNVTIDGSAAPGVTLDGNGTHRVLSSTLPITLTHLTIQNGAGVYAGGGVSAGSAVMIDTVTFLKNRATNQAGALNINGTATITNSTFISNQVTVFDTGSVMGGAIRLNGVATVKNSTFLSNTSATYGGAIGTEILAPHVPLSIDGSTFRGNVAYGGGAISSWDPLTVTNSTFYTNTATTNVGGAILAWDPLTVTNSTFAANAAVSGGAMGLVNSTTLNNVTISDSRGGGIQGSGQVKMYNTIIANSVTGTDCAATNVIVKVNDLIEDGSCGPAISGDPKLDTLKDNGGRTQTMALLAGSPAINAGDNATCVATDQRGVTRPQMSLCDIGAFETTEPQPVLQLSKSVVPTTEIPYGGVVTYTVLLSNTGSVTDPQVLLTDTLPTGVSFGQWVSNPGATVMGNQIVWNGSLINQTIVPLVFQAIRDSGRNVTNTVIASGSLQSVQAVAAFAIPCAPSITVTNADDSGS